VPVPKFFPPSLSKACYADKRAGGLYGVPASESFEKISGDMYFMKDNSWHILSKLRFGYVQFHQGHPTSIFRKYLFGKRFEI